MSKLLALAADFGEAFRFPRQRRGNHMAQEVIVYCKVTGRRACTQTSSLTFSGTASGPVESCVRQTEKWSADSRRRWTLTLALMKCGRSGLSGICSFSVR